MGPRPEHDMWAAGIILCEMLYGSKAVRRPWKPRGDDWSWVATGCVPRATAELPWDDRNPSRGRPLATAIFITLKLTFCGEQHP